MPSIVFGAFAGFYLHGWSTIDRLFFPDYVASKVLYRTGSIPASLTPALRLCRWWWCLRGGFGGVPRAVREGALACGASKWQTIQRVVLRSVRRSY